MKSSMTAGLMCVLVAGCYTYRPLPSVDAAMPAAGTQVEVRLTTAGAAACPRPVGSGLGATVVVPVSRDTRSPGKTSRSFVE